MTSKQIARLEKYIAKLELQICQAKENLRHWEAELFDAKTQLRLTKPATGFFDTYGRTIREGDRVCGNRKCNSGIRQTEGIVVFSSRDKEYYLNDGIFAPFPLAEYDSFILLSPKGQK